jgi:hypothetical protein
MTTWINVARYHLINRVTYVVAPWVILAFVFLVNLIITVFQGGPNPTKALIAIYAVFLFLGVLSIVRSLSFGLALGMSRRSYYTGTVLFVVSLAAVYGLALALLQAIERATGGWGVQLYFFQPSYIFGGAWYLTWLTSFVGLALLFVYGTLFGIVYRRWNLGGLVAFVVAQATVVLVGASAATSNHDWGSIGRFFSRLGAAGLTGVLAALAAVLLAGAYAIVRRVTV